MRNLVEQVFAKGLGVLEKQSQEAESAKKGVLRAGNSGIFISESQKVVGSCARLAALRLDGVRAGDAALDEADKELMFQAGRANEDQWALVLAQGWPGQIKREEEIEIRWETRGGITVTGRPDVVLCKTDGTPELGLELKLVCSLWTARDVLFEGRPKFGHLCQAAHYSMALGIPFQLWYTNRVDFATNEISTRLCPARGAADSQYVEYAPYRRVQSKTGNWYNKRIDWAEYEKCKDEQGVLTNPLKILPFNIGYQLDWTDDGTLSYVRTDVADMTPVRTQITRDRIRDYYQLAGAMQVTGDLGPLPTTVKGDGSTAGYSMCDYCPLTSICTNKEITKHGYKAFKSAVNLLIDTRGEYV